MLNFVQICGPDLPPSEKAAKDYVKLHGVPISTNPEGGRLNVGQFSSQMLGSAAPSADTKGQKNAQGLPHVLSPNRDYALKTLLGATSAETSVVSWTHALNTLPVHANVVAVDAVVFDGPHSASFIVMPYITSLNLREYRRMAFEQHRAISCDSLRRIALDILCGLYHIHLHGLVHRNVQPGNIIVDIVTGVTQVTDLSFSAVMRSGVGAVKATALAEKLSPESSRWADPALLAEATTNAAGDRAPVLPLSSTCDVWGFGNVLYGLFCSGDLNPMAPYVPGTSPAITPAIIDDWVGVQEVDEEALAHFRDELADLMRLCLQADPTARPAWKDLFAHPFIFPALLMALEQSRAESAALLYAHQQQAQQSQLRALFTGSWLEQFRPEEGSTNVATEMWSWLSKGVAEVKEKMNEMMHTTLAPTVSAPIPIAVAKAMPANTATHTTANDAVTPQQRPPQLMEVNTPPTPLVIASPMGTRGFLSSARVAMATVATYKGVMTAGAGTHNNEANPVEKWPASYGLLFEVEVPTGVSIVRLQDLRFSTCGDVFNLRAQLFWAPGALLTGPDAASQLRVAGWMPVCKKPRHYQKVMAKHPVSLGPFQTSLHQHGGELSENHTNTEHVSFGTRFTMLLVTNYNFGVQRASVMATKRGSLEVAPERLHVGDELAAVGQGEMKLRVFAGVACDAAVPTAIGGVLAPENNNVDDGDEGDSDLEAQPADLNDRRVSGVAPELENFQPLRSESLGNALAEARQRGTAAGFCGSIMYAAH